MTPATSRSMKIAAIVAIVFGALTVVSGGRALFGGADMGDVVPFVLWFNFGAGFAYAVAGFGLWRGAAWGRVLSLGILLATAAVFLAFLWHVLQGGAYELRTMGAMILRTAVWAAIAVIALRAA
ncbi:hypothetical protein [Ostreiculturibacter nitratireducens]|uniref:hypothetical protein n=1 Tax=Ostreiculturibacter nitratireducens TaxID=3075226 RepID=UPI0031B5A695